MNSVTLLVLAAGMGSRYGGLKQLDAVGPNGETVIDYSVFDAIRAGFKKVVFIIREDFKKEFQSSIGNKFQSQIEVEYAYQKLEVLPPGYSLPQDREKPWGTGHAILSAKQVVNEPFAVIMRMIFMVNWPIKRFFNIYRLCQLIHLLQGSAWLVIL